MYLYLVQHGEAKKEEEDPARGLTNKGVQDVQKSADFARKLGLKISRIFHSGKTRAQQTMEIMAGQLKPEKGIAQTDSLAPMDDPAIWAKRIADMNEDIMLVGHLPYMGKLAALLLCGDKEKTFVDFKMGGIACLKRLDDGRWALEWMVLPELL